MQTAKTGVHISPHRNIFLPAAGAKATSAQKAITLDWVSSGQHFAKQESKSFFLNLHFYSLIRKHFSYFISIPHI